ncbi:TetR family transcriptional regulator [Paludibacterium denitrificans]|uniref:TetR family transcriptional regulator n=1 Tax=Paludibacterium denitrificans TaxID=2675226 RepID=A0A844GD56_9NEIS|nr:TetR family transcriptional regulator [Paludibacterium denitrificans]MTD33168.1 TetR family transcriptional regulator [Paludibacterium denitrificans]
MARKTKQEAEQTRQLLIDTAERLFWEKGVSRTSLADIATAAGVTRGAIYWHFANKIDLFNAMCDRMHSAFEHAAALLDPSDDISPARRLWEHSCNILLTVGTNPQVSRIIGILSLRCEYVGEMANVFVLDRTWFSSILGRLENTLREAAEIGQVRDGVNLHCAAHSLHATVCGLMDALVDQPGRYRFGGGYTATFNPLFCRDFPRSMLAGSY